MSTAPLYQLTAEEFDMLDALAVLAQVEAHLPVTRRDWRGFMERRLQSPTFREWLRVAGPPPLDPTLIHALFPFEDEE